ncbi:MAG: DMT family transporter [Deltaproteobacteria bacterium]|nr:DMT family transporter [Deltaproteobacteria bacterium]MBI4223587.1 DMT family transporter [Deltaproteobacteria bacterium]
MTQRYLAVLLSLLSGFFIAVMVILNASLGRHIGILESSFVVHLVGTIVGMILLVFFMPKNLLSQIGTAPKYLFGGGVLGVLIVLIANAVVPKLGMVLTLGLFLTGQLLFAVIADHFGLFHLPVYKVSWRRAWGLISAFAGLLLLLSIQ